MLDIERSPERVKLDWGKNLYLRRGTTVQLKKKLVIDGEIRQRWITLGRVDELTKEQAVALAYQYSAGDTPVVKRNIRARDAWQEIEDRRTSPHARASFHWTPNTAKTHVQRWRNHCLEILGDRWMRDITSSHILQVTERMRARGYTRGGVHHDYEELTISGVEDTLSGFFTAAMNDPFNFVTSNPVIKLGELRTDRERGRAVGSWVVMSDEEVDALVDAVGGDKLVQRITRMNLRLAHGTGIRISEGLGLLWGSVDLKKGQIKIDRQLLRHFSVGSPFENWFGGPKESRKGLVGTKWRTLPLFDNDWEMLKEYREWLLSVGLYRGPESFVFPARTHNPLRQAELQLRFRKALQASGIVRGEDEDLHYHCLRHTYASKRFASGKRMEEVSLLLGHSSVHVTQKTYVHLMQDAVDAQVEADREHEREWQAARKLRVV